MRVMLQPRGNAAKRGPQNFQRSIVTGLRLSDLESSLSAHDREALARLGEPLRLWGNTATDDDNRKKGRALKERSVGDRVLFTADSKVIAVGDIAYLLRSPGVATAIWDLDEQGRPWEHIFALSNYAACDVATSVLLPPIGMNSTVRELTILSQAQSDTVLGLLGEEPPAVGLPVEALRGADRLLRSLIGVQLQTVTGMKNTVLAVSTGTALVATSATPDGAPVPTVVVQDALDRLASHGVVRINVGEVGYRSAFIGAVLSSLPGTVVSLNPAEVRLGHVKPIDPITDLATLDGTAQVQIRREQARLRRQLVGDATEAECVLCRRVFPIDLLVAAHIKKRSVCTDDEKRDLASVAMLACRMGCDQLFEYGYVSVDDTGTVRAALETCSPSSALASYLNRLEGEECAAFHAESAPYFEWHRSNVFAGRSGSPE